MTPVIAVNMPKLHQHPPGAVTLVPPKGAVISVWEEEKSCALLMEKVGKITRHIPPTASKGNKPAYHMRNFHKDICLLCWWLHLFVYVVFLRPYLGSSGCALMLS